jgi:hypothetical protein
MPKKRSKIPLSKTHPKLAKEAHGWDPNSLIAGSHKKVDWKCPKGHIYTAAVQDRSRRGDNCSICAGKKVLQGFNDLKHLFPEIASQAFGWDPATVTAHSSKKRDWYCQKGHTWNAMIASRTGKDKTGCSVCAGKVVLIGFNDLKTNFPDIAKEAFGWNPEEVTFASGKKKSWKCINNHEWSAIVVDRTKRGDGCAICSGRKVLAGFNDLATTHPDIANQSIGWDPQKFTYGSGVEKSWKCTKGHTWNATISSRTNMKSGCPYCSNTKVLAGFNDLLTTNPEIARYTLNADATKFSAGSNEIAQWKCELNHEYEMSIRNRVKASGCPICNGSRILIGFNDLATTHPEIAALANGWDPKTFTAGSNQELSWKCQSGHTWNAPVYSLSNQGTRCPTCSGQQFATGINDLSTTHPQIAAEAYGWDPKTLGRSSDKKVSWICPIGHVYEAVIYNRTFREDQCPICAGKQVLAGFNDLLTTHPDHAAQANGWDPKTFTAGSNSRVKWKCSEGHIWEAMINGVSSSRNLGCPSCAVSGFDPNEDGYLYFIKHSRWQMLQIGITNFPDDRLKKHGSLGWEVIEIRGPMDGHLTQNWETSILRMLKAKGADLANSDIAGKFDGYSEAWSKSKFQTKSIKELMKLTEEYEEEKSVTNLSHRKTKKDKI